MGTLSKSTNTPALEIIFDRVTSLLEADEFDDSYPNDTIFIAADLPDFGKVISRALLKEKPIVVVYPDGGERLIPASTARQPQS